MPTATLLRGSELSYPRPGSRLIMPVMSGLVCHHVLGGDTAGLYERSKINLADPTGQTDATITGAPPISTNALEMTGNSAYLQTAFPETSAWTIMVVGRVTPGQTVDASSLPRPIMAGTFISGSGSYMGLDDQTSPGTAPFEFSNLDVTSIWSTGTKHAKAPVAADMRALGFYAGTAKADPSGIRGFFNMTKASTFSQATAGTRTLNANNWRVGSSWSSAHAGKTLMTEFMLFDRVLEYAEIEDNYLSRQADYDAAGLTI